VIGSPRLFGALARALAPPAGDAGAFAVFDLPTPDRERLEAEHTALFGHAGRALLSPYEGVHRGTGLHEILKAYAAGGFAPDPSFRDRLDHVCLELAFLEGLGRRERRALRAGERSSAAALAERARDFFDRHPGTWVPGFFESMAGAAGFPEHRALAVRAARFLRRVGAPRQAARAETVAPAEVLCTSCGVPVGVSLPKHKSRPPPWGFVCLKCRLRADLRRSQA